MALGFQPRYSTMGCVKRSLYVLYQPIVAESLLKKRKSFPTGSPTLAEICSSFMDINVMRNYRRKEWNVCHCNIKCRFSYCLSFSEKCGQQIQNQIRVLLAKQSKLRTSYSQWPMEPDNPYVLVLYQMTITAGTEARSQDLHPGIPHRWLEPSCMNHHCYLPQSARAKYWSQETDLGIETRLSDMGCGVLITSLMSASHFHFKWSDVLHLINPASVFLNLKHLVNLQEREKKIHTSAGAWQTKNISW